MLNDLRAALRSLLRAPLYAGGVLLILALGFGANLGLGDVLFGVVLRPFDGPEPARLVSLQVQHARKIQGGSASPHLFLTLQGEARSLSHLAASAGRRSILDLGDRTRSVFVSRVSASALPMMGLPATFRPEEDRAGAAPRVLLSHGFWRSQLGGDPRAVGRSLRLDGVDHAVAGILPAGFRFPGSIGSQDLLVPLALTPKEIATKGSSFLNLTGRLAPGATLEGVRAEAAALLDREETARMGPDHGTHLEVRRQLDAQNPARRAQILLLAACGGFILLIACANGANLALARWLPRSRELGLRAALGAGWKAALRPLLLEGLLLALAGSLLAWACQGPLRGVLSRMLDLRLTGDPLRVALLLPALVLGSLVLLGAPLTWALRRLDPGRALKDSARGTGSRGHGRLRAALVVTQVATATTLLATALLLVRSLQGLAAVPLGFEPRQVLTASLQLPRAAYPTPESRIAFQDALLERLQALPGVTHAALADDLPLRRSAWTSSFEADGAPVLEGRHPALTLVHVASPDYFRALGIPLVAGHPCAPMEADTCVVSEAFAALAWPGKDPLGHSVKLTEGPLRVVGVVREARHAHLRDALMPQVYQPFRAEPRASFRILLKTAGAPATLKPALSALLRDLDRGIPVDDLFPLTFLLEDQLSDARAMGLLFGSLAGLALLLAVLGLGGALSLSVAQRTSEVGLRMALGAQAGQVVRLILGQGLRQIGLGLLIGLPAAWGLSTLLRSQLYGVAPGDPRATLAAALVLALAGLVAALIPALRAARIAPAEALRSE